MPVAALHNLDIAGLIVVLVVIWTLIYLYGSRAADRYTTGRRFEDHGRERIGLSPLLSDAAEREARYRRGTFRHVTRWSRSA